MCCPAPAPRRRVSILRPAMANICGASCRYRGLLARDERLPACELLARRRAIFVHQPLTERHAPRSSPRRGRLSDSRRDHAPLRADTVLIHGYLMRPARGPTGTRTGELRTQNRVRDGNELIGDPDKRREATELSMLKPDPEPTTCGQPGDHQQANPFRYLNVGSRRVFQPPVRMRDVVSAHPDAPVGDADQGTAAVHQLAGDLYRHVRRGERRRVLDQLGEQVHHVVDRRSGYGDIGLRVYRDALVFLDFGYRGPDDVRQHHRLVPAAGQLVTSQN